MMVNHHEREWKQIAGIASDKDQLYLAHEQCSMKKRVSGGRKRPMKSSPSDQHPNGRIVHEEKKQEQSGGHAGACMGECNKVQARESEHNEHDVHAFAHTQRARAECVPVKKREQKKDNRARAWAQI